MWLHCCRFHDKILMDKALLIMNEHRKWFLKIEPIPGEDVFVKIVKMTRDLGYCLSLVDKAVAWLERIDSNSERSSTMDKMPSKSISCHREICARKCQSMWQTSFLFHFKKLPQLPQPLAVSHHPDQSAAINVKVRPSTSKRIWLTEGSNDGQHFLAIKCI